MTNEKIMKKGLTLYKKEIALLEKKRKARAKLVEAESKYEAVKNEFVDFMCKHDLTIANFININNK